jgi:peptide/nickel transport system permease protein
LVVSFVVFTLLYITPGDPARLVLGDSVSPELLQSKREELGLNYPFIIQYLNWLKRLVFQFNLGISYATKTPVTYELMHAFPATLKLTGVTIVLAVLIGIPIGMISAVKQYSFFDNVVMIVAMIGMSIPVFWLGLMLILFFSVRLHILPSSGFSTLKHMLLPALSLGTQSIAIIARMTRSSMLEVIRQDYIRAVRAKGQSVFFTTLNHTLKNALLPVITTIGLQIGILLSGAVMAETIFSIPGIGRLMITAIKSRDMPIVMGGVLTVSVTVALVNLVIDIIYALIDPKIKAQYKRSGEGKFLWKKSTAL